ncbi:MAG: hypothetical protein Q4B22_10985, partial [Eubacteriales bacterium]|nr:hypothetical protein [Eubacteriales bacterium]
RRSSNARASTAFSSLPAQTEKHALRVSHVVAALLECSCQHGILIAARAKKYPKQRLLSRVFPAKKFFIS